MHIQVTGVLRTPTYEVLPNHDIRVIAISTQDTIKYSTEVYTTDSEGVYDFNLVGGLYTLEVLYSDTYMLTGSVIVDEATPGGITLEELLAYSVNVEYTSLFPTITGDFTTSCSRVLKDQINSDTAYTLVRQETITDDSNDVHEASSINLVGVNDATVHEEIKALSDELQALKGLLLTLQENQINKTTTLDESKGKITETITFDNHTSSITHTNYGYSSLEVDVDQFKVGDTLEVIDESVVINGTLKVTGIQDADGNTLKNGDTIFMVHQYSDASIGGTWEDTRDTYHTWARDNWSINGVVDDADWGTPYQIGKGDAGSDGDTIYWEQQYSVDGITNWHTTLSSGDAYKRERQVINDVVGDWSDVVKITGDDGSSIEIKSQYSVDGIYNWHYTYEDGDSWERRARFVNDVQDGAWSDAFPIGKGEDGVVGQDGAGWYYIEGNGGVFPSDAQAVIDMYTKYGRYPTLDDHLFYVDDELDPTVTDGKRCISPYGTAVEDIEFSTPAVYIDGDTIVKGTLSADRLIAKSITGSEISASASIVVGTGSETAGLNGDDTSDSDYTDWRMWAGASTPNMAPYRVYKDGSFYASNAYIEGEINATSGTFNGNINAISLTFVNEEDIPDSINNTIANAYSDQIIPNAKVDGTLYDNQTNLQISGGGHVDDTTQGWGVYEDGYAIFNGGLSASSAVINGGTLIGTDIYAGNILYHIDYDTDASSDLVYYTDYPTIPLSARSSYSTSSTTSHTPKGGQLQVLSLPAFNVKSCTTKYGSVDTNRFRWGYIKADSMSFTTYNTDFSIKDTGHGNVYIDFRVVLINDSNNVIQDSGYTTLEMRYAESIKHITVTCVGITFDIYAEGIEDEQVIKKIYGSNRAGNFYNTSSDSSNGRFRVDIRYRNDTYSTAIKYRITTNVDNDNLPL